MIKIKEEEKDKGEVTLASEVGKIHVTLENNEEKTFEKYPIIIKSKDIKHLTYKIQKPIQSKTHFVEKGGIIDKVKEKAKDVKDKVVDTTKDVAEKTKGTASSSLPPSQEGKY